MKTLISGITGMDGSVLVRMLLDKGHEVHGIIRRSSVFNTERIDDLMQSDIYNRQLFLHHGDLTDAANLNKLVSEIKPDCIYNLGAQSHVKVSFEVPEYTAQTDGVGVLRLLDAVHRYCPQAKFYQASTSEMFGGIPSEIPPNGYNENSPFHPRSPYGVAKLYAYWITRNYREAYNLFACNGILFNHECFYRAPTFVTKKIVRWCAQFYFAFVFGRPLPKPLQLGNLDAQRDWGHTEDYCRAMILMMEHTTPGDWVVATGEQHPVREFVDYCFKFMGKNIEWVGSGVDERGIVDGLDVVCINPKYFRPSEVDILRGDASKIRTQLGWRPKFGFNDLVSDMMEKEIKSYKDRTF